MRRLLLPIIPFLLATSLTAQQSAPLNVTINFSDRLAPGDLAEVRYTVENTSDQPVRNVRLDMNVGFPANITDVGSSDPTTTCGSVDPISYRRIGCTFATLGAHESRDAFIQVHFPPGHNFASIFFSADSVAGREVRREVVFYREYSVTTAADGGPGSLRQAVLDTNAQCPLGTPCRISFEIPDAPPAEGWFTVALASPLPPLLAPEINLDGERQTKVTGDTNPRGPEVFMDGRGVAIADGLIISGGMATVRGLAIGGFPGNGILVFKSQALIEHNYIGVDPTGAVAVPNGLRGVMGDSAKAEISGNVLSHNARSGVFLLHAANIHDNRIESNGASGIYLAGKSGFDDSFVANNVIAGNRDFGVAFPPDGTVAVQANLFGGNGWGAIDVGLDGPTLRSGVTAAPHITSARYDAASGDTVIEGSVDPLGGAVELTVYVYANGSVDANGFAEGEKFLGAVRPQAGTFTLRIHEDLRGLWIDANLAMKHFDELDFYSSSEMGVPTRVE